ncbi:glycosyltransferase family 4 protein [Patescibacteria group bacterium]|nr:glycosyltransferase family 4 protein [Patescibacteria group bacterium]
MRILLINDHYPPEGGGTAQVVKNLAEGFTQAGHDVLALASCDDKVSSEIALSGGGRVRFLPVRYPLRLRSYLSLWNPKAVVELKREVEKFVPDVIFVHNIHSYFSYRSLVLLKKVGVPLVLTLHDVMTIAYGKAWPREKKCETSWRISWFDNLKKARKQYNPFRSFFVKRCLKFSDRILCVSEALRKVLAENGIIADGVAHNGLPQDVLCQMKQKPFESHAVRSVLDKIQREHKKIILFGGRLSPAKGGKELLSAVRHLLKQYGAALVVAGEGPEKIRLQAMANRYGLQNEIFFLGQVSEADMHALYSSAYCVLVPSISFDSFPTMNLEAMQHKKPVVAGCFGGSREAVADGKTGYIVNPYDISALGSVVGKLLLSPELAHAMGEAGYDRLMQNFTVKEQVKKLLAIAEEIKHNENQSAK